MKIAIYSRKSKFTGKGESIENQITLCREYIERNIPEAKDGEIFVYEDEGFSAKNLDRPQFRLMMQRARKEPFDYIVVYRLDRISRNVGDFAGLIEELNGMHTAFICIKEQFDTSTPMGRAMMNIAAVFAQLERETIAERVRDNLILLARTGRWLGGVTPLGYTGEKTEITDDEGKKRSAFKLKQIPSEVKTVKLIFEKFLELRSLTKTAAWLIQHDIKTRESSEFRMRAVKDILKNPVYCIADKAVCDYFRELGSSVCFEVSETDGKRGIMPFRRSAQSGKQQHRTAPDEWIIALGKHTGIIPSDTWLKAQSLIGENASKTFYRPVRNQVSIFSGLVRCANCGSIMRPRVNSNKRLNPDGTQTFSYMCEFKERSHKSKCTMKNVNGNVLDKLVCDELLKFNQPKSTIGRQLDTLIKQSNRETEDNSARLADLKKQTDEKRKMISNLMDALARSEDGSAMLSYTAKEVERLDNEIKVLENEIAELSFLGEENLERQRQVDAIVKSIERFKEVFDALTVVEKRDYMHRIIDRIEWDGESAHIFIRRADDQT